MKKMSGFIRFTPMMLNCIYYYSGCILQKYGLSFYNNYVVHLARTVTDLLVT